MAWLFGSSASRSSRAASSASRRSLDRDARELSRPARTAPQPARETRSEKATPRAGRSESAAKRDGDFSRASKTPPRKHRHVSEEHAECAVCFEALCDAPTAVFVSTEAGSATRRTCAHYHHLSCARSLRAREMRRCPVCRAPFDDALAVPDPLHDPRGWFAAVDANGDGKLSPGEVLEALKARVPCDWRRLERDVLPRRDKSRAGRAARERRCLFDAWDPDGDGFIELREMVAPGGLLEYVTREFRVETRKEPPPSTSTKTKAARGGGARGVFFPPGADPPALATHPDAWFAYWDEDGSGTLDKEEVTRALVKTLRREREKEPGGEDEGEKPGRGARSSYGRLLTAVAAAREARRVVDAIWPVFCADASAGVDRAAFLKPDGLAEAIVANAANARTGREGTPATSATRRAGSFGGASGNARTESRRDPSRGLPFSRPALSLARTRSAPSRDATNARESRKCVDV